MNSSFRILSNDEPINHNLVIVVNKNGQVSTDTDVLQNLLTSKGAVSTAISILRETSPTKSIADEIEQERNEKIEMKRQEYLEAHAGEEIDDEELELQMQQLTGTIVDEIPHVTLSVESFYPPDQARKFANDVLHLGGIDNPRSLMPIDFNFRRQIILNDHCYTPLTQSSEILHVDKVNKKVQKKIIKSETKQTVKSKQHQIEEDSSDSGDAAMEDDEELEEEQSEEGEDISFSESDDDNDIDFSVNDRFGKKGKKKRKYRKQKQRSLTFKDFLETGEGAQVDDEPRKKYTKTLKKVAGPKPSTSGKIATTSTPKSTLQQIVVRKSSPAQTFLVRGNVVHKEPLAEFVPLTLGFVKHNSMQLPGQISIQSSTPMKSKQEIEFVESIVKDLEKSFPENDKKIQPNSIPNIMQMMETNTPAEMIDQSLSSLEQLDSGDSAVPGIDEIGDAIIAVLGNEAIDELLNQNDLINFDPSQNTLINQALSTSPNHHLNTNTVMTEAATLNTLPKIINKQSPVKEPVKLVRNGRVIVLPAIEAPATRGAKRRAQGSSPNSSISSPTVGKVVKTEKTPSNKDPDSRNSSRRSSLNKSESGKSSRRQSLVQTTAVVDDDMDDLISDGSWASEDDPDRLWCICKQPHNNRFMICCDKCEGWFHGKCVNVTKAMGKEFENMGKEWRCPNCKAEGAGSSGLKKPATNKKPFNQQKLTKFFAKSQKESTDEETVKTSCVVCKKTPARESSIYCSDECIQNHATTHLDDSQVAKPVTPTVKPEIKRGNVLKDKNGNVIVFDKGTGKILPLNKWPHFTSLRQWLIQNPTCKPVEPGSIQAEQLLARNKSQSQPQTPTTPTAPSSKVQLIKSTSSEDLFSNPVVIPSHTGASSSPVNIVKKIPVQGQHSGLSGSVRSNVSMKNTSSLVGVKTPQAPSKSSSAPSSSSKTLTSSNDKKKKRHVPDERPSGSSSSKLTTEQERLSIRNTFKATLIERMKEFDHPHIPKMSEEEISTFAKETEKEMYFFFNKEIREKYKMKYRSLKFNLGDVKNKTLLEKICSKKLTPKQLVELPPAALASEELSKWREDENKHQLEIITKSELDALTQNKIVMKTHKGEEIIETKTAPADLLVLDEDVESIIAKTALCVEDSHARYDLSRSISLNTSGGNVNSPLSSPSISSSTGRKSDNRHRSRSRSKSKGKDHHHHHHHHKSSSSSSSKHKKSDRYRSRSPNHSSKREKSRERSKSKKSDDHKSHRDIKNAEKDKSSGSSVKSRDHSAKDSKVILKKEEKSDNSLFSIKPDQQDVDLVGKILDSMGVHLPTQDKSKIKEETPRDEANADIVQTTWLKSQPIVPIDSLNKEIEVYSGNINMGGETDVGRIDVTASMVSGNIDDILKLIEPQLEIVGRLDPKAALDYLDKIKKHPGKELFILRFASNDSIAYKKIFDFLMEKNKFAVIKSKSPNERVKDFYLIPLESHRPLPKSLLPINGPGFVEGEANKPNLIIGAIVKILDVKLKRSQTTLKKVIKPARPSENPIQSMFNKQKANVNKLTMGLPELSRTGEVLPSKHSPHDDGDEPYTPFDEDEDPTNYNAHQSTSNVAACTSEMEMQMEKIDREIKQRQMEIQSMAAQEQAKAIELNEEQATRIFKSIEMPHNLSEILSTISKGQTKEIKPMEIDSDNGDEYVPTAMGCIDYRASSSYSAAITNPPPIAPIHQSIMDVDERIARFQGNTMLGSMLPVNDQPSRLATMTNTDLMKLVPDDAFEAPPPPIISGEKNNSLIPGFDVNDFDME